MAVAGFSGRVREIKWKVLRSRTCSPMTPLSPRVTALSPAVLHRLNLPLPARQPDNASSIVTSP